MSDWGTNMSSRGEMKMSLKLMTCGQILVESLCQRATWHTYVLVSQVLEQFQFAVGSLGEDRCAERLHNLLHRDGLVGELILGRTVQYSSERSISSHFLSIQLTRQDQKHPCQQAAGRCICRCVNNSRIPGDKPARGHG